jgi:hypothetical protein
VVKDCLTSVYILDNRQENLGQVSSFQASQPEEAAQGGGAGSTPALSNRSFRQPTVFSDAQQARPPGGILTARHAAARHNNENHNGRSIR